ncbi:molecular chaperone Skp [Candidatus Curculioniphilus buchneri]|uniref:molecular chaperone Skp n=1 Tax=Candidatus Curculioniphilus buchneri TaxID=690594 RepID=UPI00376F0B5E
MKKWLYIASLSYIFATSISIQASDKIAVVNVSSIFQQHPQRAVVAKQLENEFNERATEIQSMENDLQTKMKRLQRDGSTMKASERIALEKVVMEQRDILSDKAQTFEHDSRRRQTEERDKILNYIQDGVRQIATKENYDVVIDTNAVAYVNNAKDITNDVLKQVKK